MTTPGVLRAKRRRVVEIVAGIALVMAVATVGIVYATFRGTFGDPVHVSANISDAGDSLEPGGPVTFRHVIVGEVRSAAQSKHGSARVGLTVQARYARVIPDNVAAIAVPVNLFGSTAIDLVPPARASGRMLHDGDSIRADTTPAAAGLQTALADAYRLLTAIRPADLDAALTALATALRGEGDNLGALISKADGYLRAMAPSLPTLEATISELATVTDELARDAPNLLGSLHDLLAGAQVITHRRDAIASVLGIAPRTTTDALALVKATGNDFVTVVNAQQSVLDAFRDNPQALPRTLDGFKAFADSFAATLAGGPYQRVNVLATGINLAAFGSLIAGQQSKVLAGITDPTLYTVAQCPRYDGAEGANCGAAAAARSGTVASTAAATAASSGVVSSVGAKGEVEAARQVVAAVSGLPVDRIPAAVDLVLGPLLRGTATVIL